MYRYTDFRPFLVVGWLDVSHGNRLFQGRRKPTARHMSNHFTISQNWSTSACGGSSRFQTNATPWEVSNFSRKLRQNNIRSDESSFRLGHERGRDSIGMSKDLTTRSHGPNKIRLFGSDVVIQIVSVQAQTCLQAKGISHCQSNWLDFRFLEESLRNLDSRFFGDGNLDGKMKWTKNRSNTSNPSSPVYPER